MIKSRSPTWWPLLTVVNWTKFQHYIHVQLKQKCRLLNHWSTLQPPSLLFLLHLVGKYNSCGTIEPWDETKHFPNNMSQELITNNKLTDPTSSVLNVSEFHIQSKCYKVWSRKLEYWDPKTRSKHANWIHTTFKNQRPIIFCILITTFYNHRLAPKN